MQLKIDPEFRDKIPPLSPEEARRLEESILADGEIRDPIVVWNGTIVDGHNRWAIIQRHPGIPHKVKEMDFPDRWAAIAWMCKNQLGRRNLTKYEYMKLIQQEHDAMQKSVGAPLGSSNRSKNKCGQNDHIKTDRNTTRDILAKEHGVTKTAIRRAVEFGRGLDEAEKAAPGIRDAVLSGEVKVPQKVIAEIRKAPESKRPEVAKAIFDGNIGKAKSVLNAEKEQSRPASSLYDVDRVVEHTVEDVLEDIDAIVSDFISKVRRSLANNSAIIHEDGNKEKVLNALHSASKKLDEIGRILR